MFGECSEFKPLIAVSTQIYTHTVEGVYETLPQRATLLADWLFVRKSRE
jgi:hypothetical protein